MSILIKNMELPTNCWECEWRDAEAGGDCELMICNPFKTYTEQYKHCPFQVISKRYFLVPVPKHGRLIEDTAVREQIDEWLDSVGDVVIGHGLSYYGELLGCIEDAPTILEAEEET